MKRKHSYWRTVFLIKNDSQMFKTFSSKYDENIVDLKRDKFSDVVMISISILLFNLLERDYLFYWVFRTFN